MQVIIKEKYHAINLPSAQHKNKLSDILLATYHCYNSIKLLKTDITFQKNYKEPYPES